ncbi:MAG: PorP/SprF family type IX secretion system membrane protein [Prevotellaceae bacterium]|jgi:type IX secretion system PorP/SprF family membrane protein|nr:PorP/SprF family type IX secretion system membrane protein [Prevotellaceae bacterium]
MKSVICVVVFIVCAAKVFAQNDMQLSQYMFNQVLFNPACAGGGDMLDARYVQRMQYMGFDGAPSTWALGVTSPFKLFNAKHGVTAKFGGEKIGNFDNTNFSAGYAYRHQLRSAMLSVGFSIGGLSYKLNSPSEWGSYADDPAVPQREESASTGFDVGMGAFYDRGDFYVGFSCAHLNQPRVLTVDNGSKTFAIRRTFYLNGGYRWQSPNERWELSPTALLMLTALAKPQLGVGANATFAKRYWGGLSYRIGDALGVLGGMTVSEAFKLGVAYEYSLSKLIATNKGNMEIFVSYSFELKFAKKVKKYKSIRFL